VTYPVLALGVLGAAAATLALARWTRAYGVAVVAGPAVMLLLAHLYFRYTSDDAYISFRYALNLAEGHGPVWNPGEQVEGYTNFLWVVILAGLHAVGLDIVASARWLGLALSVAAGAGAYQLTRLLVAGEKGRLAGLAAALLLPASGTWALWATAGLETPLVAALVILGALLHIRESKPGAPPLSGIVWAFAAMARPDALLAFGVSAISKVAQPGLRVWGGASDAGGPNNPAGVRHVALWVSGFILVYLPYFIWRYAYYGWPLPNTYYAKVGSGLDQYDRGLRYVTTFLSDYGAWLLGVVLLALFVSPALRRERAFYVVWLLTAWLGYVVFVGGDNLPVSRLINPVMPLYFALIAASFAALAEDLPARVSSRKAEFAAAGLILAGVWFGLQTAVTSAWSPIIRDTASTGLDDYVEIGRWLRANVPDDTLIAVHAAGATPYESRLPAIDMLGLTDEHIAHRKIKIGSATQGHEKYDTEYVLARAPDIIVLSPQIAAQAWGRADYERSASVSAAFFPVPAVTDMVRNPELWDQYEPRTVQIEDRRWINLLVRRAAASVIAVTDPAPP
jgi:arabinofuranosyltransferase